MQDEVSELPPYSPSAGAVPPSPVQRSNEPVTRSVSLTDNHGKPYATLNIVSNARSSEHTPILYEGRQIVGSLDLNLEEDTSVKAVTVSLVGDLVVGDNLRFTFVETSEHLWSAEKDNHVSKHQGFIGGLLRGNSPKANLKGEFHWPFTLGLPSTTDLPEEKGGAVKTYRLPHTLIIPVFPAYVVYRVIVRFRYGGLLRSDEVLFSDISYVAVFKPPPPSMVRQLAYQEKSPLVSPSGDPEGWHTLEPVTIRGTAFDKQVSMTYQLSLAKPLSYTRSSVVPLHISVQCTDPAVLELISSPRSPLVRLLSTQSMGYDVWPESNIRTTPSTQRKIYLSDVDSVRAYRHVTLRQATAVWWTVATANEKAIDTRELQGEIHLRQRLQPTIHLARFNYFYRVSLYPPQVAGFKSEVSSNEKLQIIPVEICSSFADGPRPVSYSPPSYDEAGAPEDDSSLTGWNSTIMAY